MQENTLIAEALDFVTDSPKETPRTRVAIRKFSSAKINLRHKNIKVEIKISESVLCNA